MGIFSRLFSFSRKPESAISRTETRDRPAEADDGCTVEVLSATPVLTLLRRRRLLRLRLEQVDLAESRTAEFLEDLQRNTLLARESLRKDVPLDRLERCGLVSRAKIALAAFPEEKRKRRRHNLALAFTEAVNFELTYNCGMDCPHCLQKYLRRDTSRRTLDLADIKRALAHARYTGIASLGINFTGGEILCRESPIFELVAEARGLNLQTRINTSSWWGDRKDFIIGSRRFSDAGKLVAFLKECGLTMMALSFDRRFDVDESAFSSLTGAISACERNFLAYQVVCTGRTESQVRDLRSRVRSVLHTGSKSLDTVLLDELDIGGAADTIPRERRAPRDIVSLAERAPCRGRGFDRPRVIHVDPFGGVRTCAYAPGLVNLGSLAESSLIEIINRFPTDAVSLAFREDRLRECAERLYRPFRRRYKGFVNPCTACQILARLIEAEDSFRRDHSREPDRKERREISLQVAGALNLLAGEKERGR